MIRSLSLLLPKKDNFNKEYISSLSLSLSLITDIHNVREIFERERWREITGEIERERETERERADATNDSAGNDNEKDKNLFIDIFMDKSIDNNNNNNNNNEIDEDLSRAQRRQLENDTK